MSDWDADSADEATKVVRQPAARLASATVPAGRRRFDDEDEEEEVKDDWGASSDDEADKKPAAAGGSAATAPAKKKMSFKQKIAQKEAEERRRAELGLAHGQDKDEVDVLEFDPIAARRAARAAQIKADVNNAADLLGVTDLGDDDDDDYNETYRAADKSSSGSKAAAAGGASLPAWASANTPKNKAEWDSLAASLYAQTLKQHAAKDPQGFAKHFVPALTKQILAPLRDVDVRKLSTSVKGWADEKTAAEQAARRAGGQRPAAAATSAATAAGGKPKTVGTSSAKNNVDLKSYGHEALDDADAYDDDLDFM
ncbi:unnamed protein product [Parajaminaea phylloscopi]